MTADQDYHEGKPIFRSAIGGGTLILCPYGHLCQYIHEGEWAGSTWEVKAHDSSYTVKCYGTIAR